MNRKIRSRIARFYSEENGQILPWMVLMSILVLGAAGITIDLGHAFVSYRMLQASTDAAALAGAYAMSASGATTASVTSVVDSYNSTSGTGANASGNLLNATMAAPTFSCVTDSPYVTVPCGANALDDNVIQVTQTAQVPLFFIGLLKLFRLAPANSLTLSSTATAAIQSGAECANEPGHRYRHDGIQ